MADGSLRGDPRDRCGLPQGCHCALAVDRDEQRLRFHLSGCAEYLAGRACGRVGCGSDHLAVVEQAAGEAGPGPTVECHTVRRNTPWLADRKIWSHNA